MTTTNPKGTTPEKISPIFNGKITLKNPESKGHRTFRIRMQPEDAKFCPNRRILSLLIGPDNEGDYKGFAFVEKDGSIKVWSKYRGAPGKPSTHEVFADMIMTLIGGFPSKLRKDGWSFIHVLHETKCYRCNRTLTEPESVLTGVGPECRKKLGL